MADLTEPNMGSGNPLPDPFSEFMANRRTNLPVQVEVLAERVAALERALPEIKADVKAVLSLVTDLKVSLATKPTERDFAELTRSVDQLQQNRAFMLGGWKVITVISAVVSFLASALMSWLRAH